MPAQDGAGVRWRSAPSPRGPPPARLLPLLLLLLLLPLLLC
jgi:hypothetical protein